MSNNRIGVYGASRRRLATITGVAAATVGLLGLSACSAGTDTPGDSTEGGDAATLTVWHYFSADNQVELMDSYASTFEASHADVTVENVFVPYDQLNSKLVSAVSTGTGPDVVVFNGAEAGTLALAGALMPLDDYWGDYADAAMVSEGVQHVIDGELYAVQGYVNLLGLWYNADILSEIGVEAPTTMEELEAAMAAATAAGYEGITMSGLPQSQGEWQGYPWLSSAGFSYDNLDEAALAEGLATIRGWVEDGYLSPEVVNWDQTVPFDEFLAGTVAFAENGNWQMGAAEAGAEFSYGVVPLPLSDTGQVYLGGEGQAIGAFSENPDLAWQYLEETYLSIDGQVEAATLVGSIPSRSDAAEDDAVTSNELLIPFADTIATFGANYPASAIAPDDVADVQLTVGQAWSAVLGGQRDAADAAAATVATLSETIS